MNVLHFDVSECATKRSILGSLLGYCDRELLTSISVDNCNLKIIDEGGNIRASFESNHHEHHHSTLSDIHSIIDSQISLNEEIKTDAKNIFRILAEAEGKVHESTPDKVHFHEVGSKDNVATVLAICLLINHISPKKITSSYIRVGKGTVKCAHGIVNVPAPATSQIIMSLPTIVGDSEGEFCTPTSAAILKYLVEEFVTETNDLPIVGCGSDKINEIVYKTTIHAKD